MQIDSHQHYWKLERGDYGWLTPKAGILYRDYLPQHLTDQLKACRIEKTVVVQAAPTVAETEYLLSLCEQEESLAGVVGWLDLESTGFAKEFSRLKTNPYFVGIRPMLQDLNDDKYILRPQVMKALQLMQEHQFPLDLLVFPRHLPYVQEVLNQLPELKAVVNHLAKPNIAGDEWELWRSHIEAIAANPQVYCKLSGMVTEADLQKWKKEDFAPYVNHIFSIFGVNRIMFGSDWPVCRLAAEYQTVYMLAQELLSDKINEADREKIFGENAVRFYNLAI